ncbi:hypothetical protein BH11PSE14_BH11PSE14_18440 [soil metagenome]
MHLLLVLATICLVVGHLWFAMLLFRDGETLMGLLVLAIPMPLVGLFAWYQSGWDVSYKLPAIVYLAGYALVILVQLAS